MSGGTSASEDSDEDGSHAGADPRDFEAVYADQADRLHAYAASLLRGAGLVAHTQDVVQEAIIGLWKRYRRTRQAPGNWTAVMMKEVKYRALDLIKLADVRHAGFSMDDDDSRFEPAAAGDFAADHAASGPVRAAFNALDDQQRDVLYRIFYEDQTQAQVARDLGLSPGRITQIKQAALVEIAAAVDGD